MHYRNKSSHHTQPKLYTHMGRTELHSKFVVNPQLDAHARGDDDDSRQIIADLISNDDSPFTPDDEMALRNMSTATLRQMRKQYLKANSHSQPPPGDPAAHAMTAHSGGAVAYIQKDDSFARRQAELIAKGNAYPVQRQSAPVVNSNDDAVRAMSANNGAVEFLRRKREGK